MVRKGILREHSSFLLLIFRALDVVAIVGAALLAHWWIFRSVVVADGYRFALVFGVLSGLSFLINLNCIVLGAASRFWSNCVSSPLRGRLC